MNDIFFLNLQFVLSQYCQNNYIKMMISGQMNVKKQTVNNNRATIIGYMPYNHGISIHNYLLGV